MGLGAGGKGLVVKQTLELIECSLVASANSTNPLSPWRKGDAWGEAVGPCQPPT